MSEGQLNCMLLPGENVVFWADVQRCDRLEISDSGSTVPTSNRQVDGGCQLRLIDPSVYAVAKLVISAKGASQPLLSVTIDRSRPDPLERTNAMLRRSNLDLLDVPNELRHKCATRGLVDEQIDCLYSRASARRKLGGIENIQAAIEDYQEALAVAAKAGRRGFVFRLKYRLAGLLREQGELTDATQVLQDAEQFITPQYAKDWSGWTSEMGYLKTAQGNPQEAADWLRSAATTAQRIDDCEMLRRIVPLLTDALMSIDKPHEAREWLRGIYLCSHGLDPCEQASELASMGWIALRSDDADTAYRNTPALVQLTAKEFFLQAKAQNERCQNNHTFANIYTGLAAAAFQEGNFELAQDWTRKARSETDLWRADRLDLLNIEGKIFLRSKRHKEAMQSFRKIEQELSRLEDKNLRSVFGCQVAIGKLEAFAQSGQPWDAIAEQVRPCLDKSQQMHLSAKEVVKLTERARAVGFAPVVPLVRSSDIKESGADKSEYYIQPTQSSNALKAPNKTP